MLAVDSKIDALVEMVRAGRLGDAQVLLDAVQAMIGPGPSARTAAAPVHALRASVLGPVSILCDGVAVERWHSRRGLGILKYLLLHRERPVSRDSLMAQFWPDADTDRARNCLNVAVHGLRKSLRHHADDGAELIVLEDGCYAIAPDVDVWVDHDELRSAGGRVASMREGGFAEQAVAACERAEALWRGPLFDGDPLEDWFLIDRQAAADALVDVLHHHAGSLLDLRRPHEAIDVAHRILRSERSCERAHLLLMQAYVQLGQINRAVRQYAECSQVLDEELGVGPGAELEALRLRLAS